MNNEDLKIKLTEIIPSATFEEAGGEWVNIFIEADNWKTIAQQLFSTKELGFNYLFCLTCIDWLQTPAGKTHFTMVYHLTSTMHRHSLVVKTNLDRNNPEIETVSDTWRTAEFHEREVYDLFGVVFKNHPDLRRLFMTDEWIGWPLRKDYEDPINMIKL